MCDQMDITSGPFGVPLEVYLYFIPQVLLYLYYYYHYYYYYYY